MACSEKFPIFLLRQRGSNPSHHRDSSQRAIIIPKIMTGCTPCRRRAGRPNPATIQRRNRTVTVPSWFRYRSVPLPYRGFATNAIVKTRPTGKTRDGGQQTDEKETEKFTSEVIGVTTIHQRRETKLSLHVRTDWYFLVNLWSESQNLNESRDRGIEQSR